MMMNELLSELSQLNIKLWVEGDQLCISAPKGVLTAERRNLLSENKARLISLLKTSAGTTTSFLPQIVPAPEQRYQPFPLTEMQQAYWLGRSGNFELGNIATHFYTEIESRHLDIEQLETAWQQLIERHDALRTVVLPTGEQQILERVPRYEIEVLDLRGLEEETVTTQLEAVRHKMSHQVLATEQWPLFDIKVTRFDNQRFRLHISLDLLIVDLASILRLLNEWVLLYQNQSLPSILFNLSFRDYVLTEKLIQNTPLYQHSQDYWFSRLDTLPPAPELPLAQNPSSLTQPRFKRRRSQLDPKNWLELKQRAAKAGLTSSGILLAAYAEVLTVWSKSPQFTLNLTLFNRLPLHPQVNEIIGDFTSISLLAVNNSASESFTARANRIQEQLWQDLDHLYVSGVEVLRELARQQEGRPRVAMPVVFTSALSLDSTGQKTSGFNQFGEIVYGISQTPQVWLDHQVFEQNGALVFNWDAVEELFPEGLLDDMFESYCCFLRQLATSESAWSSPTRQLVPPTHLAQRAAINATEAPISDEMLHTMFIRQVEAHADKSAVISPQRTLTYLELSNLANQIGYQLRQLGALPNTLVAIVMEKGWEQVVAALGILISGAAYLPIDPKLPQERQWYLLEQGEVELILTQSKLNGTLAWPAGIQRLCVDHETFASAPALPLQSMQNCKDLAYVIYTSGSTGLPKGVAIDHRGAVNTIKDINQRFEVDSQDRVLALSALNFDLSVYDIFGLLAIGGTIVIPAAAEAKDPAHWFELIIQHQVTLWNSVPALMQMQVEHAGKYPLNTPLRLALLSGDWIPLSLPSQIQALWPNIEVVSLGGATEASIWSIFYPIGTVDPAWKSIPYGKPLINQQFHVLNESLDPCPVWVPGQLYIGGIGVAKEYWRNEEKTKASFITHPHTGERLYKTGDLGRYLPDGNIEFLGREDFQVKINGYRIELGEIEANLVRHPAVKEAIVTAVGEPRGNKQLVAYVIPELGGTENLFEIENADYQKSQTLWKSLVTAGRQQAKQASWDIDLQTFSTLWEKLDRLYINSVCQTLKKLNVFNSPGEKYHIDDLMAQCKIAPRYRKWLKRALKALGDEGWLKQHDETFESLTSLPTAALQEGDTEIKKLQKLENTENVINLLIDAAENLANIITENIHSAQIYASEETPIIYQQAFSYGNAIVREVMKAIVQSLEPAQPLRILEVGAGYGSTTVHVLPLLPSTTTYVFTDISNFFLQKANQHFAAYPFVRYGLLDLEKNPQAQGYNTHDFDVVIASNVLHDTRSIAETLQNIRSLLAPSGFLLMVEETKFHRSFDLGMGLQQGFDRFEDTELRPNHPLLSREQWQSILSAGGFDNCAILNQPGSIPNFIGVDVLVAKAPLSTKRFKPSELRNYLSEKLPDYMVPSVYILLDVLPLTANGKVDRKALPMPETARPDLEKTFVAPRSELEKQLANIWADVLGLKKIGIYDNFFEVGGDSLLSTRLISPIREAFSVDYPLRDFFETPTVAGMAEYIETIHWATQNAPHNPEVGGEEVIF